METLLQRKRRQRDQRRRNVSLDALDEPDAADVETALHTDNNHFVSPAVISGPIDVNQDQPAQLDWRVLVSFTLLGLLLLFLS